MEQQISTFKEVFMASSSAFLEKFMSSLSTIIGAVFLMLVGWLAARLFAYILTRLLRVINFDTLANRIKVDELLAKANITLTPSEIIGKFIYWIILLFAFVMVTETLGWNVVSEQISELINFLPTLFSGIVLFVIGIYIASFLRDIIAATTGSLGIGAGKAISGFVFYFLMVIVTLTSLDQIGIDTTIITSNVVLIIGAVLLAASISYGIASKDILSNMLASFFSRKTFLIGQTIRIDDIQGTIIQIDSISLIVQTKEDKIVIPTKDLIVNRIHIID